MFLTRKHLSRRTLLKGAGVSLALPFLDAMIPAGTALAQAAAARKLRVGFFYLPHGAIMDNTSHGPQVDRWTPSGSGAAFNFNVITKSLEPYKKYVTSFGNIKNDAVGGTEHILNPATWLSGVKPIQPGPSMSATLDQVIAGHIAQDTPVPSLEVSSERAAQSTGGVGYHATLSFRDPTSPLRMEFNPREVFLRLFGRDDSAAISEKASLLDLIADQTRALLKQSRAERPRSSRQSPDRGPRCRAASLNRTGFSKHSAASDSEGGIGILRRTGQTHVRYDRHRLSGGPDARRILHDGRGKNEPNL